MNLITTYEFTNYDTFFAFFFKYMLIRCIFSYYIWKNRNFRIQIQPMRLFKLNDRVLIEYEDIFYEKIIDNWDKYINRENLRAFLLDEISNLIPLSDDKIEVLQEITPLPPIGLQELWAAGVTYKRSKEARMEESEKAGASDFYDKVYDADRPELFFKAMSNRIVGTKDTLFIRKDSTWNVPEPELTLYISSFGTIEGYTIGNDMSSRSIEGENPLYLPQAKTYERCAGLGPCIYIPEKEIDPNTRIAIQIDRGSQIMYQEEIQINQIKRRFGDLVAYLYRECHFPSGCFLMTGTGMIPPDDFSLQIGDIITIQIDSIGVLVNTIAINESENYKLNIE